MAIIPNLGQRFIDTDMDVVYFDHCLCQKAKKRKKVKKLASKILLETVFFKFAPQRWSKVLWGNKTLDQHFGANFKSPFLDKCCNKFLDFFLF